MRLRAGEQLRLRRVGRPCGRDRARGAAARRPGSRPSGRTRPTSRTASQPRSASTTRRSSIPGITSARSPGSCRAAAVTSTSALARSASGVALRVSSRRRRAGSGRPRRRRDATAVPRPRPLLREGASGQVLCGRCNGRRGGRAARHVHQHRRAEAAPMRSTPAGDGRRVLIVGGEGGRPARGPRRDGALRQAGALPAGTVRRRCRIPVVDARLRSARRLPYIGRLLPGADRVLVATGFAKWGMTKGTLAAAMLTDAVRGRPNDTPTSTRPRASTRGDPSPACDRERPRRARVRARPRAAQGCRVEVDALAPGEGTVCRIGTKHYAVHRDGDGRPPLALGALSPPRLHRRLERRRPAWECPCHGSRFALDGSLVQGPATQTCRRTSAGLALAAERARLTA